MFDVSTVAQFMHGNTHGDDAQAIVLPGKALSSCRTARSLSSPRMPLPACWSGLQPIQHQHSTPASQQLGKVITFVFFGGERGAFSNA